MEWELALQSVSFVRNLLESGVCVCHECVLLFWVDQDIVRCRLVLRLHVITPAWPTSGGTPRLHSHRSQHTTPAVVSLTDVSVAVSYRFKDVRLETISLNARMGEIVFVMGPKGSGKTTLLEVLGCVPCMPRVWLGDLRWNAEDMPHHSPGVRIRLSVLECLGSGLLQFDAESRAPSPVISFVKWRFDRPLANLCWCALCYLV